MFVRIPSSDEYYYTRSFDCCQHFFQFFLLNGKVCEKSLLHLLLYRYFTN
ncbi:hypothetical protein CLOSTMETH_02305 [[Clostridium] methylpentosum DSM 5476]|uniref:Uncharacterized protein n=1 Tax=[Clostridium] methylpentosum DSM 5476 TaxID=537013 RepID=C0EEL9_9FIRM|nr:hypothetical protein CLOSTMETH_02305 [[Clostridium] methylpentosum DSM 5476]